MAYTYKQARRDYEYLEDIYAEPAGGYDDHFEDFQALLKNPTKGTACKSYVSQIQVWMETGPEWTGMSDEDGWRTDPKVREIAKRYHCEMYLDEILGRGDFGGIQN